MNLQQHEFVLKFVILSFSLAYVILLITYDFLFMLFFWFDYLVLFMRIHDILFKLFIFRAPTSSV